MASLTGQTIASTYDALLKITDNGPITASLKQITDGLGNNTPLYLSATTVYVNGAFRVSGAFFDANNEPGSAGQFLVSTGVGVDWQNISESGLISGSGTNGFISKFTAGGVIANSVIQESSSNIGIGISPTQKLHVDGNGLFTGTLTASNVSGSTSGVNTGDETNTSIKTKLGAATAISDGYLTAVDYELFTNKVPSTRTITINGDTQDLSANRTFNVNVGVTSFNTRTGAVVLSSGDVTTALGYTPALESRIMTINGVGYSLAADRSWSVGTVTSVGTSAPLTGGTITGAGTIGITQANASTDGYLSSTDWNTFNNKQAALGFTPENSANKGIANGYASLDGAGKVPSTQLPSYVDDVVEVANFAALPATGETGKIYITLDTNFVYRWSGSVYVKISEPNAVWGSITGTLSNQTDLQSALDAKVDDSTTLTINGVTSDLSTNRTFNVGTVTSVSGTGSVSGLSLSGSVTTSGSLTLGGTLSLTSSDVTTGLGYTPVTNARTLSINGAVYDLTANRSWSVGTVTSVGLELGTTGTDANIANSPITSSGNITLNLPTASASNRGLLSSTDWSTFNAKQNALTLTTTGSSGSATLVGSTLNIPTYTLAGLGGQPLLTNPVTGTGTSGYLTRFTGTTTVGNSVIFDNGSQIGIGTTSPSERVEVNGSIRLSDGNADGPQLKLASQGFNDWNLDNLSGAFRAYYGSTEYFRISSTGNVGIGSSSPSFRLTTNFSAPTSFTNAAGDFVQMWQASGTNGLGVAMSTGDSVARLVTNNGYQLAITAGGTETARFTSSGNLGIGTTSPVYPLQVNGLISSNRTSNTDGGLVIGTPANGNYIYGTDSGNYIATYTANTERVRVTSGGNVGIGTTNPVAAKLSIVIPESGSDQSGLDITNNVNASFNVSLRTNITTLQAGGAGNMVFANSAERMRITSGGNVGIGTSSPTNKFEVFQANNSSAFSIRNGTTSSHNLLYAGNDSSTNSSFIGSYKGDGSFYSNLELQKFGGNVGIGTSSPVAKLSAYQGSGLTADAVISTQHAQSTGTQFATHINFLNSSGSQAGFISANGTTTFYGTSSDYRLKKDLKDYSGLSLVGNIKTYDYQWESDESRMYGVLAHELAEVLPYAVNGEKDGEMMQGVDYSKIVPVLVKAIQELTEKVNQLENK